MRSQRQHVRIDSVTLPTRPAPQATTLRPLLCPWFLIPQVRSNPWAARRYREEADKVEETSADSGELGGMQARRTHI